MTDKEARIYEQNCQEFRSLNGFFWQVPLIMMTLNGGLWYSVASLDLSVTAQRGVLAFAVVANLVMAVALGRLRDVMASLLFEIHAFQGTAAPGRARLIQYLFQGLMLFAAIGAFLAALNPQQQFIRKPESKPVQAQPAVPPTNNSAKREGGVDIIMGRPASNGLRTVCRISPSCALAIGALISSCVRRC